MSSQNNSTSAEKTRQDPLFEKKNETVKEVSSFASFRDLVESLVFAVLLAFFIKTFEVEAFVIPTGSMAPTLKGRHKDVTCSECGFRFQVNASEEIDNSTNRATNSQVIAGTCSQCGFTDYFDPKVPSYTGDRILVCKNTFDQRPVRRWDVSVFRAPAEPKVNFIKRVVGLPNERLRIQYGDIFIQKKLDSGEYSDFEISRKPVTKLLQMLQPVHDNDYPLKELCDYGWLSRWSDENEKPGVPIAWERSEDGRSFHFSGAVKKPAKEILNRISLRTMSEPELSEFDPKESSVHWLRYRHIVPSSDDWLYLMNGSIPPKILESGVIPNNPQLIVDQTSYNSGYSSTKEKEFGDSHQYIRRNPEGDRTGHPFQCRKSPEGFGYNWTGDLSLSCTVDFPQQPFSDEDELLLELVKGGTRFLCRIHPMDGRISLEIPGVSAWNPDVTVYQFSKKTYRLQFMNIDEQMRLLIDEKELTFPNSGRYDHLCKPFPNGKPGVLPRNRDPNEKDLRPAAIGVKRMEVTVQHLLLERDIYYIAMGNHLEPIPESIRSTLFELGNRRSDRMAGLVVSTHDEGRYMRFLSSPRLWKGYGNTWSVLFELDDDQYLALGDNSGLSHDSRLWGTDSIPFYVDKKFLIGKAFYVYWPHGQIIPRTRLPFVPEFSRMRHID